MKHIAIIVVLLAAYISTSYCQDFRITPNNNQYYSVKYYHKKDSNSLGKFVLIFSINDPYVSTFTNPLFLWNDGSGTLESKMISPGKYQIDLSIDYKKVNANCITVGELETPRIIDVEINNLKQQLISIEYLSNLSRENIYDRISRFNPVEANYGELISFVYNLNHILRRYDPYCELALPELITGDLSKEITNAVNSSWKKARISLFYSLCEELSRALKNNPKQSVDRELISRLAKANTIKLNYYNAYQIEFLIGLMEGMLALPSKPSADAHKLMLKGLSTLNENPDSTNRFLVIANVVKNGYKQNNLLVACTPASVHSPDDKKSPRSYFSCPSSPSFGIFPEAVYILWVENKKKEKLSNNKLINLRDVRYKEIVFPVNGSLAVVRIPASIENKTNINKVDFYHELDRLIIKHNCLFLLNISVSLY